MIPDKERMTLTLEYSNDITVTSTRVKYDKAKRKDNSYRTVPEIVALLTCRKGFKVKTRQGI